MQEIERKYLVRSLEFKSEATSRELVVQGFLNTHPRRTVRVRVMGEKAFITVKGKSNRSGMSRYEWEHRISADEAKELLALCEQPLIEKFRYLVPAGSHFFEIDEFMGVNTGLIIAEVELKEEEEVVTEPAWLGREVTGIKKYYNSHLIKKPYNTWKHS